MTKRLTAFRLEQEQLDALAAIKTRDGIPATEQVKRALAAWIEAKGIEKPRPTGKGRRR